MNKFERITIQSLIAFIGIYIIYIVFRLESPNTLDWILTFAALFIGFYIGSTLRERG